MKVAELKQVVDANAVEMREGFASVREEFVKVRTEMREGFAKVDDDFTDMRREMRAGFAVLERRIDASRTEMRHDLTVMTENLVDQVAMAVEQKVELMIDHKIAAAEVRLERKFTKRRAR